MRGRIFTVQNLTQGLTSCLCSLISGILKCQHEFLTLPNAMCLKTCSSHFIPLVLCSSPCDNAISSSEASHLKQVILNQHIWKICHIPISNCGSLWQQLSDVPTTSECRRYQISGWGVGGEKIGSHTVKTRAKYASKWGEKASSGHLEQKGKEEGRNHNNKLFWLHNLPKMSLLNAMIGQ